MLIFLHALASVWKVWLVSGRKPETMFSELRARIGLGRRGKVCVSVSAFPR